MHIRLPLIYPLLISMIVVLVVDIIGMYAYRASIN